MNHPVRSKMVLGTAIFAVLGLVAGLAWAQLAAPVAAPGGGDDIVRIRKLGPPIKEKTPVFRTAVQGSTSARQPDWWRVVTEYETKPDWIDELEFTYYVFLKDQSNKNAEVLFRTTVTYVNIAKGRHQSDVFLHPTTLARMGLPEFVAVVIKAKGAVVATESTAKTPNWWERFSPVDGVLLHRGQTPFAFIDYDLYEAIKPAAAPR